MDGASAATEIYIVPVSTEETGTMEDGAGDKLLDGDDAVSELDSVNDRVFCCQDCGEAFREEAAYSEHRRQHLRKNAYLDVQLEDLRDAEKDNETDHFCTLCSLSFVELTEFHLHMEKHHGQTSQKTNSGIKKRPVYECEDCGKCYCKIGHFLNHQRSHKPASSSVLQDPEHLKKRPFQCETCGRNYSRASALDAHRRCHEEKLIKSQNRSSGQSLHPEEPMPETKPHENQGDDAHEKLFKCVCGKSFSALSRLKTHQRFSRNSLCSPEEIKEKSKKNGAEFYCHECNKVFNGQIGLLNHQRWHANHSAQRFSCEECGKVLMTLTSYYRHQRTAHSHKTPAKSFLHQVCQLKKKAFECKDCGLKFSRASALHSHQLHHTDVFKEAEKEAQAPTFSVPQQFNLEIVSQKNEHPDEEMESEIKFPCNVTEEDSEVNETDEDMESYEPGDFNVQVISASESEDEPVQDLNPDLELVCESDQEARDDGDCEISSSSLVSRTGMDLKIVQIDFEQADGQHGAIEREPESQTTEERFDCPQCYRWFTSASSLRVHRMWHNVHKRRRQTQDKVCNITCDDCGLKFTNYNVYKTHLHQHAMEEEEGGGGGGGGAESQTGENANAEGDLISEKEDEGGNGEEDANRSSETKPSESDSPPKSLREFYSCEICGKGYTYLVSFQKHLLLHEKESVKVEDTQENLKNYQCSECGMLFIRRTRLQSHMQIHRSHEPKALPPCDLCNRSFTTPRAWTIHMDIHRERPFWCLSCSKGFRDDASLDKHLQNHSLRRHKCQICSKSFQSYLHLVNHLNSHTKPNRLQCPICGRNFSSPSNLLTHKKRHVREYLGAKGSVFALRKNAKKKKRPVLDTVQEEPEMETNTAEMLKNVRAMENGEAPPLSGETWKCLNQADSDESDCGEPQHRRIRSDPPAEIGSEAERLDNDESQETNVHREHRYWEFECFECDMGFDDVEMLHKHYVQHATGELPFTQSDVKG